MPDRKKKFAKVKGAGLFGRATNPTGGDIQRLLTEGPRDVFKAIQANLVRGRTERRILQRAEKAAAARAMSGGRSFNPSRAATVTTTETDLLSGKKKKKTKSVRSR